MVLVLTSMIAVAADTLIGVETRTGIVEADAEVRTTDVRETDTERELRDTTTTVREELREVVNETRDRLRDGESQTREVVEDLRREAVETRVGTRAQIRAQIRAELETQRAESYREARLRYSAANEDYAESRRALIQAEARGDVALEHRKRVALSAIVQLESYLDLLERRVQSSDAYDDDERERVLDRLGNYRERLEAGRARVDAAQSVEQLSNVIGTLRGDWGRIQAYAQATAHQSLVAQISNLIVDASVASDRADARIAALARTGADVDDLEALKARYDARVEAATEHVRTARRAYSAEASAETRAIIGRSAREARAELSEAYLVLRELIAEMRETTVGASARAEVTV